MRFVDAQASLSYLAAATELLAKGSRVQSTEDLF